MRKTKGKAAATQRPRPDWRLWLHVDGAELWELVQLSLDREPNLFDLAGDADPTHHRLATLRHHVARGSTILRRPDGYRWLGERDSPLQKLTIESFRRWAAVQGWEVPEPMRAQEEPAATHAIQQPIPDASAMEPDPAPEEPLPPRQPMMQSNRERVLKALRSAGLNPAALPPFPKGAACPSKAAARAGAKLTDRSFEHAWKELLGSGEIVRSP